MSGGIAFVYDPQKAFPKLCNRELVDFDPVDADDLITLTSMIEKHAQLTGSHRAGEILHNWGELHKHFVKVMPRDYKAVLAKNSELKVAG